MGSNDGAYKCVVSHSQIEPDVKVIRNYACRQLQMVDPARASVIERQSELLKSSLEAAFYVRFILLLLILFQNDPDGAHISQLSKYILAFPNL